MITPNIEETPEYRSFTSEEQVLCMKAFELFLKDEIDPALAWRNAVAERLQHQRMTGFHPTAKQYRELFFWEAENKKKGMSDEEADQAAWKRVMRGIVK
jgi:hypothetical protein